MNSLKKPVIAASPQGGSTLFLTSCIFVPIPPVFRAIYVLSKSRFASVGCQSIRGIISFRLLCKMRGQVQQDFVLHTQDSFHVLCLQKYKYLKKSSKYGFITICKQPFGENFFTRCLTLETCTFGPRNIHC